MWNGKWKAVTFSFDDGATQDIRFVGLLNKYGLKCTFNLNSGIQTEAGPFAVNGMVVHRMNVEGLKQLYMGHEIASHGLTHADLVELSDETIFNEVKTDIDILCARFNAKITGFAYPYGSCNDRIVMQIKKCGISYARTVGSSYDYELPEDPLRWCATCHYADTRVMELIDEFLALESDRPQLLSLWGHSYEFDIFNQWEHIERIMKNLSGREDIFYGSNAEVLSECVTN